MKSRYFYIAALLGYLVHVLYTVYSPDTPLSTVVQITLFIIYTVLLEIGLRITINNRKKAGLKAYFFQFLFYYILVAAFLVFKIDWIAEYLFKIA